MPRRLNILLSAYACEPDKGSEPEVGWKWATHLAQYHNVTVLTRANNEATVTSAARDLDPLHRPRFVFHDLGAGWLFLKRIAKIYQIYYIFWQRAARAVVARLIKNEHFDILHHLTYVSFRHNTAIWGHGIPTVWGPIGGIEITPWSLLSLAHPKEAIEEGARNLLNAVATSRLSRTLERGRVSTRVLASSPDVAFFFKNAGIPAQVLPAIAIDATQSSPLKERMQPLPLRLIYCGRMIWWKGLTFLLKALKKADETTTLTLIGDGPILPKLRKSASKLGILNRVDFRGKLTHQETLTEYQKHDVLAFPSLHDSGGFVVLEAMAQGLPVICLDAGGPAFSVSSGGGICVKIGTAVEIIDGLATAIRRYSTNRILLAKEGNNANAAVIAHHTWEKRIECLNEVYAGIIQSH